MSRIIRNSVWECMLDLGVTVIYAAVAGLAIVGVVASDNGPVSILTAGFYASLLPGAVLALVVADMVVRVFNDLRAARRHDFGSEEKVLSFVQARTE